MNGKKHFSWEDVRYFLSLVSHTTLKKTALHLGVEHTTVARRISSLEEAIKVKLFDRLPRAWAITDAGKALLPYALEMEKCTIEFKMKAENINPLLGKIKISAPPILISHFFSRYYSTLKQARPDIDIEWIGETRKANLNTGEADLAIRLGGLEDSNLKMRKLGEVEYAIYHHKNNNSAIVDNPRFIQFGSPVINAQLYEWYQGIIDNNEVYARTDDFLAMMQLAQHSDASTLLPDFLARQSTDLVKDTRYSDMPTIPAYLLIHADIAKKPLVKAIAEELVAIFRSEFKAW